MFPQYSNMVRHRSQSRNNSSANKQQQLKQQQQHKGRQQRRGTAASSATSASTDSSDSSLDWASAGGGGFYPALKCIILRAESAFDNKCELSSELGEDFVLRLLDPNAKFNPGHWMTGRGGQHWKVDSLSDAI